MNDRADALHGNGRLLAWSALVGASALLIIAIKLIYDVPDDLRYRYSTVLFAIVVSALQLAVTLKIAGPSDLRDTFALKRASWSCKRVALTAVLIVIGMLVVLALLPSQQQGEAEGNGAPFDAARALPYLLNAIVLVIVSPILEELMFRGLGFKLLERYGRATAIVLTGLAFGLFHGQLQQLPALIAFGCAMGYLRSATNSIYPAIATHALLNLTGVALTITVTA